MTLIIGTGQKKKPKKAAKKSKLPLAKQLAPVPYLKLVHPPLI